MSALPVGACGEPPGPSVLALCSGSVWRKSCPSAVGALGAETGAQTSELPNTPLNTLQPGLSGIWNGMKRYPF